MPKGTMITLPEETIMAADPLPFKPKRLKSWKTVYYGLVRISQNQPLLLTIIAFIISRVSIMGELGSFGIAFFLAAAREIKGNSVIIALGVVVGLMSTGRFYESGAYFATLVLYFLFLDKLRSKSRWWVPLAAFCFLLICQMIAALWKNAPLYDGLQFGFNAAMGLIMVYLFIPGVSLVVRRDETMPVTRDMVTCLTILLAVTIAGLGNVTITGYSLRNIIVGFIIMAAAFGGAGFGAGVGAAMGLVLDLTSPSGITAVSLYAIAGLFSGAFRPIGKIAVLAGFLLGTAVAILCFGRTEDLFTVLPEGLIGGIGVLFVSTQRLDSWGERMRETGGKKDYKQEVEVAISKLKQLGAIFGSLAESPSDAAATVSPQMQQGENAKLLSSLGEQLCGSCTRRTECWDTNFYRTYQALLEALTLTEQGDLKRAKLSQGLLEKCVKPQELNEFILTVAKTNCQQAYWKRKTMDARRAMTDQMQALADILVGVAQELKKEAVPQSEILAKLVEKAAFVGCEIENARTGYIAGRVHLELDKKPCQGNRDCCNTLLPIATALLKERLILESRCGNAALGRNCRISLRFATHFKVVTGVAGVAKEPGQVSGDCCTVTQLDKGKIALLLSDGMGSGPVAAGKSSLAVEYITKMLAANFSVDVAVKTVNALLLLKQPEESFATIDLAVIDGRAGEAEFLKVGAAPSFIKRVGEVVAIKSGTLPMGILQHIEIEPVTWTLAPGDIIVMVSDGIADILDANSRGPQKELWIVNFLRRMMVQEPQKMADLILQQAMEFTGGHRKDDMTILVGKIAEP
ncbi:MAG: stage sporulation protein serine/threonine phosphatase [Firmicutes bacterium]|nr:stage sporulation protein serine/threonine phosphatase [Bacillota bacterium]